jgi:hypothetical protein
MRTIVIPLPHTLAAAFRSRATLQLEITALRQQLTVPHHGRPRRPHLRLADRPFWVRLSRLWSGRRNMLIIGKPDTPQRLVQPPRERSLTFSGPRARTQPTAALVGSPPAERAPRSGQKHRSGERQARGDLLPVVRRHVYRGVLRGSFWLKQVAQVPFRVTTLL